MDGGLTAHRLLCLDRNHKIQEQIMNFKTIWLKAWLLVFALSLVACAPISTATVQAFGRTVDHTFEFDASRDSRDIEVLRYRYGGDGGYATKTSEHEIASGRIAQSASTTGDMLLGKDLYVKWRIKSTGQVLEDTVDLLARLPDNMKQHRVRFIVEDEQLYVYVISRETVRPYFSQADADKINAFAKTPREKSLTVYARNRVTLIYPEKQIDPHLPADLRK